MKSSLEMQNLYTSADEFNFYAKESAKLSEHQALYEISKQSAVSGACQTAINSKNNMIYAVWDSACNPSVSNVDDLFKEKFKLRLSDFISSYPDEKNRTKFSVSINGKRTSLKADSIHSIKFAENGIMSYSAEYTFDPSFDYDLELGPSTFRYIYQIVSVKLNGDCKKKSSDPAIIKLCMDELGKGDWTPKIYLGSTAGKDYLFFDYTTNKNFFINDESMKWQPLTLRFAISI
jgi:hypothetical protein